MYVVFGFCMKTEIACYLTVLFTVFHGDADGVQIPSPLKPQCAGFVTTLDTHRHAHI